MVAWLHHPMLTNLNVCVVRKGEPPHLFPEMDRALAVDLGPIAEIDVVLLEGGTSSDKASVMLRIPTPDGHFLFLETTLSIFATAMRVAEEAFPDEFTTTLFTTAAPGADTPGSN